MKILRYIPLAFLDIIGYIILFWLFQFQQLSGYYDANHKIDVIIFLKFVQFQTLWEQLNYNS